MSSLHIGYGNYGLRDEDIFQAIPRLARLGCEIVELTIDSQWPTCPARMSKADQHRLIEVLQSEKLPPPVAMLLADPFAPRIENPEFESKFQDALLFLANMNFMSPAPVILTMTLGMSLPDWASCQDQIAGWSRKMALVAADHNVILAIEPHALSQFNSPEKAEWLINAVDHPNFRLNCDISHFLAAGMDYVPILERLIPCTAYAHIKEVKCVSSPPQFLPPGEGHLNLAEYFGVLKSLGFTGDVVVEISGQIWGVPDYQPWQVAEKSLAALREARNAKRLPPEPKLP